MIQVKKCDCKNNWTWKNSCFGLPNSKSRWYKLPPFIVFEGTRWETVALDKEIKKCCIVSSPNAWMNTELTHTWVNKVLDTFSFRHCYLVWDSMNVILKILQSFRFMQKRAMFQSFPESAQNIYSEVSWNKPFKALATEKYDQGLAEEGTNQGIWNLYPAVLYLIGF